MDCSVDRSWITEFDRDERLLATSKNQSGLTPGSSQVSPSPFRAGAAHVVQLGTVRVGQRGPRSTPLSRDRVQATPLRRGREQHSQDIRV
jgi:hypothetical protein